MNYMNPELSIVIPCLNESETLRICIQKCKAFIESSGINTEIIVADNGSTDGSLQIAETEKVTIISVREKGYGSALIGGINAAKGKFVIMGDADNSYDFSNLKPFVDKLREGFDLVIGNRFKGGISKNAMPLLHKYLGNPVLSFIGRLFFKIKINDFHCGLRGFSKSAFLKMELQCRGMEFASEMIVKAALKRMKITEVPTTLEKAGRSRPPHLRTWRDGWRHLRFLLLLSPAWLFLLPGMILFILGTFSSLLLISGPINYGKTIIDIHSLAYTSILIPIGLQLIFFFIFAETYGSYEGLLPFARGNAGVFLPWKEVSSLASYYLSAGWGLP